MTRCMSAIGLAALLAALPSTAVTQTGAEPERDVPRGTLRPAPELGTNPFSMPKGATSGGRSSAGSGGVTLEDYGRDLRAVLVGRSGTLVNIGGRVIGAGEEVEGYRLVSVRGDTAVFLIEGRQVEINIGEELPNE